MIDRAFARLGLAVAMALQVREKNIELPLNYSFTDIDVEKQTRLREAMRTGQVTTIVGEPEPLQFLTAHGAYGYERAVYGVWMERKASFYGQRTIPASSLVDASTIGNMPVFEEVSDE